MKSSLLRQHRSILLLLLVLGAATSGCGASAQALTRSPSIPSSASPAPTNTPASWHVYRGAHFTISYPPGWTYGIQSAPTGTMGTTVTLQGPAGDALTIAEWYGYTDAQFRDLCRPNVDGTPAQLAGLPTTYMVVEGVHRSWQFINSQRYSYGISTDDGMQSPAIQAAHDQILATFKPDDPTPGCQS